jgi:hypothetical protein
VDGSGSWEGLLASFAPVFTSPSFGIFLRMATAWALCPGRRVVTRIYQLAEPLHERAHDAYHRFLRAGAWTLTSLFKVMAQHIVSRYYKSGTIPLDLDDTLFHKSGRHVDGASWWRDAVRSTGKTVVHALGLNLVVLTVRVTPPWGGEPLGLPINFRLHRKGDKTTIQLAEEMVTEVTSWFPDRDVHLCADGAYATLAGYAIPRFHLTSRMRRDAALYTLPPKRHKGQRGRPRKKGRRLPTPEQIAKTKTGWKAVMVPERGKRKKRLVLTRDVLWYNVSPNKLVRLVISRDPEGKERDVFFFTTDLSAAPEDVISRYAGRWSIEDTFRNCKQMLGGQQPQTWKDEGPERAAGFCLWLYSAVWFWYLTTIGKKRSWLPLPWYPKKSTPSFADALAAIRRAIWRSWLFDGSTAKPLNAKTAEALIEALAHAA